MARRKKKVDEDDQKQIRKVEREIVKYLDDDEEIVAWANGKTTPAEWMSYIPGLSVYYKMKSQAWIIVLTEYRIVLLESTAVFSLKIKEGLSWDIGKVKNITMKSGVLFATMFMHVSGKQWLFRDCEKDDIVPFIKAFKRVKRDARG